MRLRVLRAERGLTLREAEELTGVGKDAISQIERGLRQPHDVTLAKIARGNGVPVADLLGENRRAREAKPSEEGAARGQWRRGAETTNSS
jgi:transcriptional regulator with XRE-family HTH domain